MALTTCRRSKGKRPGSPAFFWALAASMLILAIAYLLTRVDTFFIVFSCFWLEASVSDHFVFPLQS
jgi:hypothetical protein